MNDQVKQRLSDTDLTVLIESYEALGNGASIMQKSVLAALRELEELRQKNER